MEYFKELSQTKIFAYSNEFECQAMMFCFKTKFKTFEKHQTIVKQGDPMENVVLIVKGGAKIENLDNLGNINILTQLKAGGAYGIETAYAGNINYKDSLIATEKTLVLFMNRYRLLNQCDNRCKRHEIIIKKINQMIAENNIELQNKLSFMSKKTIREKLLSYFLYMTEKNQSNYFEIPFNVTELANYLSVDRSALSNELGKMKKDNIIDYDKKQYRLIKSEH